MSSPSGAAWPPALRRKLGIPPSAASVVKTSAAAASSHVGDSNSDSDSGSVSVSHAPPSALAPLSPSSEAAADSILSAHQLRKYIHKSYAALASIQRQLYRGEEAYFEETYAHGNLMQGWDNIWIEHPNSAAGGVTSGGGTESIDGSSSGSNGGEAAAAGGKQPKFVSIRKMPSDHRWFSSSCVTVLATSDGRIAALERPSLIDRPPTPEVKEEEIDKTRTSRAAQSAKILATEKVGSTVSLSVTKNAKVKNAAYKIVQPKTKRPKRQQEQSDGLPLMKVSQPPPTPPVKSSSVSKEMKMASPAKDQKTSVSSESTASSLSIIPLPNQRTVGLSPTQSDPAPSSVRSQHQLDPPTLSANLSLNPNHVLSSKSDVESPSQGKIGNATLNLKAVSVATDEALAKGDSAIQVTAVAGGSKAANEKTISIKTKVMSREKDGRQRTLTKGRDVVMCHSPLRSPLTQLIRARAPGDSTQSKFADEDSPGNFFSKPKHPTHRMAMEPPVTTKAGTKPDTTKPEVPTSRAADVTAALSRQKPPAVSTPARRVGAAAVQHPNNDDDIDDVPLSSLAESLEATPIPPSSASSGSRRMSSRITRKRKAAS